MSQTSETKMSTMTHPQLLAEQEKTLTTPRLSYGILAKILFVTMDLFYGRKGTLPKFKVLEIIARMPYQSWENVAYVAITHKYKDTKFARRVFDRVQESRVQQDNEQWHLLIISEQIEKLGMKMGYLRYRLIPQIIAFVYYNISWLLYVIKPSLSYRLNMEFEDHAEHEYMQFVAAHPELEAIPFKSDFEKDYGKFKSVSDMLRQIALDERHHKEESSARIEEARFK